MNFIPNLLGAFWFLIAAALAFYIPGRSVTGKLLDNKSLFEKLVVSLTVGIVFWTLQAFFFGFSHLRDFSYFYILIFLILYLKRETFKFPKIIFPKLNKLTILIFLIFLIGIFGQQFQFFLSGFMTDKGVISVMTDVNDSIWHTAVISELIRRFPPEQPGLSGVILYNYHFLSDLPIAELIRIFHLPLLATQFQYMNILLSFLFGGNAYILSKTLGFPLSATIIFVYLQYFSSDVIYLLTLFTRRMFEFTVHPLEDGIMFLENPPRALSYIMLLSSLYFLYHLFKTRSKRIGIITILILGSIIGFKIHTAFGVFGGLGLLSIYLFFKKDFKLLSIPLMAFIVSMAIHLPVNKISGIPFYAPFELSRMFTVQRDLALSRFELARRIYLEAGNTFGQWRMDTIMIVLFFLGQFGIKNVGFIPSKSLFKKLGPELTLFIIGGILALFIVATFFYQPIGGADIFNFYLAMFLVLGLFASYNLAAVFNKSKILAIFSVSLILIMTLPRWIYEIGTITHYFEKDRVLFSSYELNALDFLKNNTPINSIVLVANKGQADYAYPYVTAFSQRDTFLSGQNVLFGHSIPFGTREKIVKTILYSSNSAKTKMELKKNNISYIYFYGNPTLSIGLKQLNPKVIFSNKKITVYQTSNN